MNIDYQELRNILLERAKESKEFAKKNPDKESVYYIGVGLEAAVLELDILKVKYYKLQ